MLTQNTGFGANLAKIVSVVWTIHYGDADLFVSCTIFQCYLRQILMGVWINVASLLSTALTIPQRGY